MKYLMLFHFYVFIYNSSHSVLLYATTAVLLLGFISLSNLWLSSNSFPHFLLSLFLTLSLFLSHPYLLFSSFSLSLTLSVSSPLLSDSGWSTSVPTYNPREIISNLRLMIAGENPTEMHPWYRGFKGK